MDSKYVEIGDTRTRLQAILHTVGIILLAFVFGLVIADVLTAILAEFVTIATSEGEFLPHISAVRTIAQFVGFMLAVVVYLEWRDERSLIPVAWPTLRSTGLIVAGFLTLFVLNIAFGLLLSYFGIDVAQNSVIDMGNRNPVFFLYMIPISLLFVGPAEELLFRGVIQELFKRAYGLVPGILIASALFGMIHVVALLGESPRAIVAYLAVAGLLGVVLGTLYEITSNIVVPAVIHGVYNALLFAIAWANATYDLGQAAVVL
ncbi:MAG: CPBP family intramembrane glutamic endopeptidase [Halovenus sp.]